MTLEEKQLRIRERVALIGPNLPKNFRRIRRGKYRYISRRRLIPYLRKNEGLCPLCLVWTPQLVHDHCHKSNRWRGWICYRCNTYLGFLENGRLWYEKNQEQVDEYLAGPGEPMFYPLTPDPEGETINHVRKAMEEIRTCLKQRSLDQ